MHSSYQVSETHHGNLNLKIHDRINDLNRRARALAPAVAVSAMDSGASDLTKREHGNLGPRQLRAWDMIAEAYSWNAISDDAEALELAEHEERMGRSYRLEYNGSAGYQVVLAEQVAQCQAETADHACVYLQDGHRQHRDGAFTWYTVVPTETVVSSEIVPGDTVLEHGMAVRIDSTKTYTDGPHGPVYAHEGTAINLAEVLAAGIIPPGFLTTHTWVEGTGWTVDRRDRWVVQGNDLARWTVERLPEQDEHRTTAALEAEQARQLGHAERIRNDDPRRDPYLERAGEIQRQLDRRDFWEDEDDQAEPPTFDDHNQAVNGHQADRS